MTLTFLEASFADVPKLCDASDDTMSLARMNVPHADVLPAVPAPLGEGGDLLVCQRQDEALARL